MEHGRVAGANMAGQPQAYRGSLLMNIVEVLDLEIASFGAWDAAGRRSSSTLKRASGVSQAGLAWRSDHWRHDPGAGQRRLDHQRRGHAQRAGAAGTPMGDWKGYLQHHLFEVKRAFMASGTTARLLPLTVQGRASVPAEP